MIFHKRLKYAQHDQYSILISV